MNLMAKIIFMFIIIATTRISRKVPKRQTVSEGPLLETLYKDKLSSCKPVYNDN